MSRGRAACLLFLGYAALALLFTYPLVSNLDTHHVGEESGDAKTYLWNYWWVREALIERGTSPFETDAIFFPLGIGLALHTLGFAQGLAFLPLSALFGDVAGANLIVLSTFVLSALFTYALARHAGASSYGAFLGGLVFAFCPSRLARLSGHYDLLGTEWMPLYALLLLKVLSEPRLRAGLAILAGVVLALCGYTAMTYMVFLAVFTVLAVVANKNRARITLVALAAAALLAPLLVQLGRDLTSWTYAPYPGADRYAADLAGFVTPSPRQSLTGGLLGRAYDENLTETTVFAGYLVVLTALWAVWKRKRGLSFWLVSAAAFFTLSLGTSLHVLGADTGIPLPFALLSRAPLLEHLRAPSRFAIPFMMSLAIVVALVFSRARASAVALAGVVVAAEYLAIPAPLFAASTHPVYAAIGKENDSLTVVEVPGIEQAPNEIMFHQRIHEKPIFVGGVARAPIEKSEYYLGLPLVRPLIDLRKGRLALTSDLVARERESAPEVARFLGIGYFVIDRAYEKRGVIDFIENTLPVDRWYEDEMKTVLKVKAGSLPSDPFEIAASGPASRQHFESGWLRPEEDFRWAHRERSTILFRRPRGTHAVVIEAAPLGERTQSVEARLDGRWLARAELPPGWSEARFTLSERVGEVERLELEWSWLSEASGRDPRRLAARVRYVRFE